MIINEKNLMSIGEIAKSLNITRRIILNYEARGLVIPDRKESSLSNRYYSIDTLTRIRTIRVLQNLGLTLDEIGAYFNGTVEMSELLQRLEFLRDELNLNIEKLRERVKKGNDYTVQCLALPAQTVYCSTQECSTILERLSVLRETVFTVIRDYGTDTSKRMFFIEYPLDRPQLVSFCVAVPPDSVGKNILCLPEEKALCIFYHGSYESIPAARDRLLSYAGEHDISLRGSCRHIYLEGPPQHTNPDNYITQIGLPIAPFRSCHD